MLAAPTTAALAGDFHSSLPVFDIETINILIGRIRIRLCRRRFQACEYTLDPVSKRHSNLPSLSVRQCTVPEESPTTSRSFQIAGVDAMVEPVLTVQRAVTFGFARFREKVRTGIAMCSASAWRRYVAAPACATRFRRLPPGIRLDEPPRVRLRLQATIVYPPAGALRGGRIAP